jgi:hypothetical protein
MTRAFLITIIFTIFNCVFAQHDHNKDNSKNLILIFTTQNEQYSADVESVTDEFVKDSSYAVSLKLTSSSPVDSASVKLSVLKNDSIQSVNHMELLNDKYSTRIKFKKEGKYILKFTFNLISDDKTLNSFSFNFSTNVKSNSHAKMEHSEGMMGMGSTGFWLIMGGIMAAMMAVIMILNSQK